MSAAKAIPAITPELLDEIELRARDATSGPWGHIVEKYKNGAASDHGIKAPTGDLFFVGDYQQAEADAAHIAIMDPSTTLALIADFRRVKQERDALAALAASYLENYRGKNDCIDNHGDHYQSAHSAGLEKALDHVIADISDAEDQARRLTAGQWKIVADQETIRADAAEAEAARLREKLAAEQRARNIADEGLAIMDAALVAERVEAARLRAVVEKLRKDEQRLNFLDHCNLRLNERCGTKYSWKLILNNNVNRLMLDHMSVDLNDMEARGLTSCRAAIDAAMPRLLAETAPDVKAPSAPSPDAALFVKDIIKQMWDASEVDGGWLQDEAVRRGFLVAVAYDPNLHGGIDDAEPGETVFVLSDRLKDLKGPDVKADHEGSAGA